MNKFSILMSIYDKERAENFDRAMKSIWDEQSIKPSEIVLIQDGKLNDSLLDVIRVWKDKLGEIFKLVKIEKNVGLGDALNLGIKYCSFELVARMDTDDISLYNRFEKQIEVFQNKNIDICSSWIGEFDTRENNILGYRKVPKNHEDILKYAKIRNPINHPAVMYKKSAVEKAGGYKRMYNFEDYYLWIRMILTGSKFYNIQETLLLMRAGYEQLERRSGIEYAKNEFIFLNTIRKENFLNIFYYLKNLIIKIPIRLVPKFLIKIVYKQLRKY